MIVDIHRHLVDMGFFTEAYWKGFAKMALPILKRMGVDADIDTVIRDIFPVYFDPDGEKHVAAMEEGGLTAGEVDMILGRNAASLLSL
jgi:hypothetical protein